MYEWSWFFLQSKRLEQLTIRSIIFSVKWFTLSLAKCLISVLFLTKTSNVAIQGKFAIKFSQVAETDFCVVVVFYWLHTALFYLAGESALGPVHAHIQRKFVDELFYHSIVELLTLLLITSFTAFMAISISRILYLVIMRLLPNVWGLQQRMPMQLASLWCNFGSIQSNSQGSNHLAFSGKLTLFYLKTHSHIVESGKPTHSSLWRCFSPSRYSEQA